MKVGFYCEHAFALYDIQPIFEKYKNKGDEVFIITLKKYKKVVDNNFLINESNVLFIDDYKNKIAGKITQWYQIFGIREDFSEFYYQRKKIKHSGIKNKLSQYFKFIKVDNKKVNPLYSKLIKKLYKLKLLKSFDIGFDSLFVVTKIFHPYLLTPYEKKIFLIIESWDHPSKEPFLVNPNVVFSWNNNLNKEIKEFQNYKITYKMQPLKFRYICEYDSIDEEVLFSRLDEDYKIDVLKVDRSKTVVYPMCTSSTYYAFEGEVEFVRDLAMKLKESKLDLYIRPYPLAPINDVEALSTIPNVKVGLGNNLKDGLEVFNEKHQIHKYLIIKNAYQIINVGTTFVFDAALLKEKKKIIQLKIDDFKYGDFNNYSKGVHIKKYLHDSSAINFDEIANSHFNKSNFKFREHINDWIMD